MITRTLLISCSGITRKGGRRKKKGVPHLFLGLLKVFKIFLFGLFMEFWIHESKRHGYNFSHSRNIQKDSSMCEISDEQEADFAWRLPGVTPGNREQMGPRVGVLQHRHFMLRVPSRSPPHWLAVATSGATSNSRLSGAEWKSGEESCLSIILATLLSNIFQSKKQQTLQKPILFGSTKNRVVSYMCIIYILVYIPSNTFCAGFLRKRTYYS